MKNFPSGKLWIIQILQKLLQIGQLECKLKFIKFNFKNGTFLMKEFQDEILANFSEKKRSLNFHQLHEN